MGPKLSPSTWPLGNSGTLCHDFFIWEVTTRSSRKSSPNIVLSQPLPNANDEDFNQKPKNDINVGGITCSSAHAFPNWTFVVCVNWEMGKIEQIVYLLEKLQLKIRSHWNPMSETSRHYLCIMKIVSHHLIRIWFIIYDYDDYDHLIGW